MSHNLRRVPTWLLAIGLVLAVAVHAMLFLRLGTRVTMAAALGIAVLVIVAKHPGLAAWLRRKPQDADTAAARDDEASP